MKNLFEHINKYVAVTEKEFEEISSYFTQRHVAKKETLYNAGDKGLHHYHVLEGCIHMYFIDAKGAENTLQFALKDWWLTDYLAFQKKQVSEFYIEAVEPSMILEISAKDQEGLFKAHPVMESYFRNIYQIAYGASLIKIKYIYKYSKEEMYYRFRDAYPHFVNNAPQYMVATFLGLSPEYVSKLRKKSVS
ncbi:MAG: cyclic nucleotide-binding protein [Cytophagaceae bacterium]|nr:cyclic nucleotide-binding protein [Cytophagaceae bacterium]|tara:strand:- start:28501 stop:29073 length:573 start_codon:yes stop_codon:yes gene_type:complete